MPLLESFHCNVDRKVYVEVKVRPWILNENVAFCRYFRALYQPSGDVYVLKLIFALLQNCISNNFTAFNLVQVERFGVEWLPGRV